MRKCTLKTAALLLLLIFVYGTVSFADSHGIIKYRQNVMKSVSGHMGAIVDILKNGLPLKDHIVDHALSMQQISRMTLSMFPEGSGKGRTKSKQVIWEQWSEFESAASDFERESIKLVEVAQSGDMEALSKQVRATGKTCSGCHRNFRKRN
jgi:cytochrome c556|tara:strand:+ start:199 stop:651 length:453 start_codon:yes stop_codon:yes gene_type:complete